MKKIFQVIVAALTGVLVFSNYALLAHAQAVTDTQATVHQLCCSSVLFIPGLEGTRLYKKDRLVFLASLAQNFGPQEVTRRLWEPSIRFNIDNLLLDDEGSSTDNNIFSGDPIDKAYNFSGVYDKFMNFMDSLVANGTIQEWRPFGYDWRKSISNIALGTERKATTTQSLLETVVTMAERSPTGKVSIVAHSTGGLVAKYLVKTLTEMGKNDIVDKVISVAVPYLGTPQAIAALLYGDGQSIGGGLLLREKDARNLGANMPSAYSLLPSAAYYTKVFYPTIAFASTVPSINDGSYPKHINNASDQNAFITDSRNVRMTADIENTHEPLRGNPLLTTLAEALHNTLDVFKWPDNILTWSVVGWNKDTLLGLQYVFDSYSKYFSKMGDGTVIGQSASYDAGTTTAIDLAIDAKKNGMNISHANILESTSTQNAIRQAILGTADYCAEVSKSPAVSCGEPDYTKSFKSIVVSTHSPVDLHIYDKDGHHTGVIDKPAGAEIEDGLITFTEENIPGSTISFAGSDTYITLPDQSDVYKVMINGTGIGTFDLVIDKTFGTTTIDHVILSDLPVTPFMTASTTLDIQAGTAVGKSVLSKRATLNLDVDGNGMSDILVETNNVTNPLSVLDSLESILKNLSSKNADKLLKRLANIRKVADKQHFAQALKKAKKFEDKVNKTGKKKPNTLSVDDREDIVSAIDTYITLIEEQLKK